MKINTKKFFGTALAATFFAAALSACSPEVGSKEWCDALKEKAKGEWSANEATEFAKSCVCK